MAKKVTRRKCIATIATAMLPQPVPISRMRTGPPRAAPRAPGQHSDEVLRQYGYGDAEIAELREAGVVA